MPPGAGGIGEADSTPLPELRIDEQDLGPLVADPTLDREVLDV